MKNTTTAKTFLATVLFTACASATVMAQHCFTSAAISAQGPKTISFTVSREVNVFSYRIEAGNDSVSFDVIGTIRPKGNSMLALSYSYPLYETGFKYYRICKVGMDARTECVNLQGQQNMPQPGNTAPRQGAGPSTAIATN